MSVGSHWIYFSPLSAQNSSTTKAQPAGSSGMLAVTCWPADIPHMHADDVTLGYCMSMRGSACSQLKHSECGRKKNTTWNGIRTHVGFITAPSCMTETGRQWVFNASHLQEILAIHIRRVQNRVWGPIMAPVLHVVNKWCFTKWRSEVFSMSYRIIRSIHEYLSNIFTCCCFSLIVGQQHF